MPTKSCCWSTRRAAVDRDTRRILDRLAERGRKSILALNKIDLVRRDTLLGLAAELSRAGHFDPVFMISGLNGDGVEDLKRHLAAAVPPGPWLFPEDQLSDAPERLIAAEVTREQVFLQLHDELPYASTVETESWDDRRDGSVRIEQVIYVERQSQRAIVLGEGGQRIKAIGARARAELEQMLERRVHLFLFVKVRQNWGEDRERFEALGLDLRRLMEWRDTAFVVAVRRHGESALIVELLTREHGRHLGLVRGGQSPKARAILQPGNEVAAAWRGRLTEHLGTIACELVRAHAARFIDDPDRLAGLAAATALIAATLPEREPHADVFASFCHAARRARFGGRLAGALCRMGVRPAGSTRLRSRSDPLRRDRSHHRPRLCLAPHRTRGVARGGPPYP